ncbi:DUF7117 family protein [Haladaptatus caseinilyticus]|uniref:DUF7117 family protein n=1 Tax=Haladaptatus caseinilyticus TaxID=2993314 RepID=UPI00224B0F59|nr:TFIIB-type zinc ribbon-containing protein [Haladaptatus caseinilyticus]
MKVRGTRECQSCGTRWTYYETGSVACPNCESMRSVGLEDNRVQHTDSPVTLELSNAREAVDSEPLREVATLAADAAGEYVRKRGFIKGGELRPLDDRYLAAQELRHASDVFSRTLQIADDEELYFLSLLREADAGERPPIEDVPQSMHDVRGLADAEALHDYYQEMSDWVREHEVSRPGRNTLETLGEHVRRARALEGGLDIETTSILIETTRELARSVREGDEDGIVSARERLGRID